MGDHHHPHEHEHEHGHEHGPLEAITHVHGGAMVLDIGGSVGALHVLLDDEWAGRELFLVTDSAARPVHTGVWRRHGGGGHVVSALFGALEAGRYGILDRDGEVLRTIEVRGGELTEVDVQLVG